MIHFVIIIIFYGSSPLQNYTDGSMDIQYYV